MEPLVSSAYLAPFSEAGYCEVELPNHLSERLLELSRDFYEKPLEQRMATAVMRSKGILGYYPSELEAQKARAKYGEIPVFQGRRVRGYCSFDFMANENIVRASSLFAENRWPPEDLEFAQRAESLYGRVETLMRRVACAALLELSKSKFDCLLPPDACVGDCCSLMRLLRYPSGLEGTSKVHSDYELISLVVADKPGLEILSPQGKWVVAPCNKGKGILIPGDMFEAATNGAISSTLHRVRYGGEIRYAAIFFQGIKLTEPIKYERLPNCPETFGQHLLGMLVRGAPHLSDQIQTWERDLGCRIPAKNPFHASKEKKSF